jgi:hypothetical protein
MSRNVDGEARLMRFQVVMKTWELDKRLFVSNSGRVCLCFVSILEL